MSLSSSCTEVAAFGFRPGCITVHEIKAIVADVFELPVEQLASRCRDRKVAWARQEAMRFTRELTNHSLPNIGRLFGHLDHTTVIYAIRTCIERDQKPILESSMEELGYRHKVSTIRRRLVSVSASGVLDKSKISTKILESAAA